MNSMLAVDTNAVIEYRAGVPDVCRLIESADLIILPAAVLGELLYGAINSPRPQENEHAIRKFLAHSFFAPVNEYISARYANIRLELKKIGRPIPENDIWIAATCLELGVALLTEDTHFNYISNLQVVNWAKD